MNKIDYKFYHENMYEILKWVAFTLKLCVFSFV